MVWPVDQKSALLHELQVSKSNCAGLHAGEAQALPGVASPWPVTPGSMARKSGLKGAHRGSKKDCQRLPFVITNYASPSEAAADPNYQTWSFAKNTRLTDTGIYLAIKALTRKERGERHPYDFIRDGDVFRGRISSGKPVIIWAHGLAWIAVWRKSLILCGEKLAPRIGWLLPRGLEEKYPSGSAAFLAGIVLTPTDIFPLEPGTFQVDLTNHDNPLTEDILIKSLHCWRSQSCQTKFCADWHDLIIDPTPDGPVLTPMSKVNYIRRHCADPRKYCEIKSQIDVAPDELFPTSSYGGRDIWEDFFYLYPRYPEPDTFESMIPRTKKSASSEKSRNLCV